MTVRRKLIYLLAATAVLGGLILGGAAFGVIRSALRQRYTERLRSETDLLSAWISSRPAAGEPQRWAHEWGEKLDLRLTLIGQDGRVLGDSSVSDERLPQIVNHLNRPEVRDAARTGWGQSYRTSESTGETYFYLARRLDGPGLVGFVRVALPAWQVRHDENPSWTILIVLLVAAPFLVAGMTFWAVHFWARPLEDLSAVISLPDGGGAGLALTTSRDDEIGAVARAVERTRQALLQRAEDVERERRRLLSVVAGMREGLLLVDEERRVRLANEAFRQTWGVRSEPDGRPLAEVVRHPQVLGAVEAVLADGRDHTEHISSAGRAFEVHAAPLPPAEQGRPAGAVVLFFDVTRLEALESVRRSFVANVSHELRTPLTAIKAAALTLLEGGGDSGARLKFLETIHRNAERMSALVDDLTDLSLIESGAIKLDLRPLDLAALARDAAAQVAPRYAALGLQIALDLPSALPVNADRRRLEQILVNLLDNAMKFNRPGGRVRISGHSAGGGAVLVVEDTGIGIPSDHLDQIFHRFHRVDPTSSREFGGTGLGLAIVKHLVQLHGGAVRVESELGRGSRFTVEL